MVKMYYSFSFFFFVSVYISRVKLLLRKTKYQEQILQKTNGQLKNLEQLIHDMEFSRIEIQARFHHLNKKNRCA
jgi:hypothetical protein